MVEGAAASGSRISVDHALDLGRDVFAVPGPVTSPLAEVPLALIREGATMIRGADDLLDDLGVAVASEAEHPDPPIELPDDERRVWRSLAEPSLPDARREERLALHPRCRGRVDPPRAPRSGPQHAAGDTNGRCSGGDSPG